MIYNWLEDNKIKYSKISEDLIEINGVGKFLFLSDRDKVIDEDMNLILYDEEELQKVDYYCFKWGKNYYYSKTKKVKQFDVLKYIGEFNDELGLSGYPFLGIHGGYDILNGSRDYKDWCKKAKFLGVNTLGICEKNTLGGVLKFQLACEKNNLHPVIGEEVVVKQNDNFYQVKLYVKSIKGWQNLLVINKEINVVNSGNFIEAEKLISLLNGLVLVLDPKYIGLDQTIGYELQVDPEDIFFQIDTVIYENEERDKWYLDNIAKFIDYGKFNPVLINDAYYLDKEDFKAKLILNNISNIREHKSRNQYFKSLYDNFEILDKLFKEDGERFLGLFQDSIENLKVIETKCVKFNIQTKVWHLPVYKQNEFEHKEYKGNNKNLFLDLIQNGLETKVPEGKYEEYKSRVEEEYPVIVNNGFIDYFLILWDIVKWAKNQGILCGIGRGSASGCLISFLLDITGVDPIEYGLLFERFLNQDRIERKINKNFVIIETNNSKVEFEENEKILIYRENEKILIKASEIIKSDKLI